uniref:Uncharacterized protein n=1 Tax=Arundo donax TaxID=35708 RepID=A0A0A9CIB2_ARUDO
MIKDIVSLEMA